MTDQKALYPIREISRLTGVTPITLRAWERRYDLVEPVRTETGHRLYTEDHVSYIKQAVELTKQGIPISKVKSVIQERKTAQREASANGDIDYSADIIEACRSFDFIETQMLVEQMFVDLLEEQVRKVIIEVSLQLLNEDVAEGILWQSVVTPLLSARIRQGRRLLDKIGRKNIYIAAIDGRHPVLQRMMANAALEAGYNPMLGLFAQLDDLIGTVNKLACEAVVLIAPLINEDEYQKWLDWAKRHPSVEIFLAVQNDKLSSSAFNFKVVSLFDSNWISN